MTSTENTVEKALLKGPDGTIFSMSFDGTDLWIHIRCEGETRTLIERFEQNAANEGWLRVKTRPAVRSQPLHISGGDAS
jgi:hypothetical protein